MCQQIVSILMDFHSHDDRLNASCCRDLVRVTHIESRNVRKAVAEHRLQFRDLLVVAHCHDKALDPACGHSLYEEITEND
jgi:hypothetical protein